MSLEDNINRLNATLELVSESLQQILQQLSGAVPDTTAPADDEPAPKARKAKAKAAPKPEPETGSKDTLIAALKDLQAAAGAGAVRALLDEHGARNVGGLPEDKYAEVAAAAVRCTQAAQEAA